MIIYSCRKNEDRTANLSNITSAEHKFLYILYLDNCKQDDQMDISIIKYP